MSRFPDDASARAARGRHPLFILLAIFVLSGAWFGPARAAIIHVPGDAPTIHAGIALAAVNDTVLIASGSYTEDSMYVNKNITITGPPTQWPTIHGRSTQNIFVAMPGTNPTFQRMVLRDASVGVLARNDDTNGCGSPGANMTVRSLVLVNCTVGVDADDSGCTRGSATIQNCTAIQCGTAYQINDYGSVTGSRLIATRCTNMLMGAHYISASFSCLDSWQNGQDSGDTQPISTSNVFHANPRICDEATGNFGLGSGSPCLPANNACGQLLGALDQQCVGMPMDGPWSRTGTLLLLGTAGIAFLVRRGRRLAA